MGHDTGFPAERRVVRFLNRMLLQLPERLSPQRTEMQGTITGLWVDASKHQAVSYKRLLALETQMRQQVSELFALGEQAEHGELTLPAGFSVEAELAFRQERLANLATAKAVLEARAQERAAAERAVYDAKVRAREEKARQHKRPPRGRAPHPVSALCAPGQRPVTGHSRPHPDRATKTNTTSPTPTRA